MNREEVIKIIDERLAFMIKQNKLVFDKPMQILDGNDIVLGQSIGTRIGTSDTQKLAFFGGVPRAKYGAGYLVQPVGGTVIDNECRASLSYVQALLDGYNLAEYP